ncbi:MAG: SWIM zinc finger domain-containing protein [Prevotellaceae bacterium]|jgi:hypothetical protein|nr:SWIM zinc finger domain-containing protein [Prevotellaceae bacterium]
MTDNFTELEQTAENSWQARYHGNYGIYTVKLEFDKNGRYRKFSCTCPSDGYPCKHIGFLQTAIEEQVKKFEDKQKKNELTIEDVLQNVSLAELRTFVIQKAKYNNELTKAITLEFAGKLKQSNDENIEDSNENIYKSLVADDLCDVFYNPEDYYEYGYNDDAETDLSILGDWRDKAKDFVNRQQYEDALLICQAVIEEYADWYEDADDETRDYIFEDYQSGFFNLLQEMAENEQIDKHLLYDYCKQELSEEKYSSDVRDMFNDLMALGANTVNPDEFIAAQKELLTKISDKSSSDAGKILKRLYNFYSSNNQEHNASNLVEENLQIESFCKIAIEKRISEKRYDEAKQLIVRDERAYNNNWNVYKLDIAQKEKDIPAIRKIAFKFIANNFDKKYFGIYKTTFSEDEWREEFEKLYKHYDKKENLGYLVSYNSNNIPDLLVAENLTERLIDYIESHLSVQIMKKYYTHFAGKYPGKTLEVFRKTLDSYAKANTGDEHYSYVSEVLKLMKTLPNGDKIVSEMIDNYRIVYKRRKNMIAILNKI